MEDTELIARVYPVAHGKKRALKAIEASPLHFAPQHPECEEEQEVHSGCCDRQPTEPPEDGDMLAYHGMPCIDIRFSNIPRSTHGIIFGRNPKSDVVIPFKSVSNHHFGLSFDDNRRLIVKDWGSLSGTEVTYDGEGRGKRRGFCWIVGGHSIPHNKKNIIVVIDDSIAFQVVPAHHDIRSQVYIERVDLFRQGAATAEDLFSNLDLPKRPDTRLPTGTHTPSKGEIHLTRNIGKGSFGVVTHFWNVSTGIEYALKEPNKNAVRRNVVDVNAWRKEARIMADLSHVCLPHNYPLARTNVPNSLISCNSSAPTTRHTPS